MANLIELHGPTSKPGVAGGMTWWLIRCCCKVFPVQNEGRVRFASSAPVHVRIPSRPQPPKRKKVWCFVRRTQEEIARNRPLLDAKSLLEYQKALQVYRALEGKAKSFLRLTVSGHRSLFASELAIWKKIPNWSVFLQ